MNKGLIIKRLSLNLPNKNIFYSTMRGLEFDPIFLDNIHILRKIKYDTNNLNYTKLDEHKTPRDI